METVIVPTKELAPIKSRLTKMQTFVDALVIKDEETQKGATDILSGIKSVAKEVEAKKKEITKPINAALKAVRALFLPLEESYKGAERIVKTKMVTYHQEQEKIRLDEEAKLAKRVESGTMKVETAAKKLEAIPEVKKHVDTGLGAATIKKAKKFKVVDITKLPMQFHLPNEVAIRRQMNDGVELAGVEYWEEDTVSAR